MPKLKAILKGFEKEYGRDVTGVLMEDPPRLPTGIFSLDLALGGGFPRGRVSVLYGLEASMKSTICMKACGMAQQMFPDMTPVYIDVEGHFSKSWAKTVGLNPDKLVVLSPRSAEEMVDMVYTLLQTEDVSVVVVDSLAALTTAREQESKAEDHMVGTAGLLINKFYRKITHAMSIGTEAGRFPTLLCINQIRYKIGVMMGDPETMPGGPSFRFVSSMTLRLTGKEESDKAISKNLPVFRKVSVIVKKYKVAIVQRNSEFLVALRDLPTLGLKAGEAHDMPRVMQLLKSMGMLTKGEGNAKGGWVLEAGKLKTAFLTLDTLKERMASDPKYALAVKQAIFTKALEGGMDGEEE